MSIEQLRERMPTLRQREQSVRAELQAITDQADDRATFLRLAETLTAFFARLHDAADTLSIDERQRIVRLVVKDVLIGEDTITIRHSIPVLQSPPRGGCLPPSQTSGPNYLLCKGSDHSSLRSTRFGWHKVSIFHDAGLQPLANQAEDATITDTVLDETDQPLMADRVEESGYIGVHDPVHLRRGDPDCQRVQRIVLSASGPEPVRKSQEVYFVDGIEHLHDGALNDLVLQRRDA